MNNPPHNTGWREIIHVFVRLNVQALSGQLPSERVEDLIEMVEQRVTSIGIEGLGAMSYRRIKFRNHRRVSRLTRVFRVLEAVRPDDARKLFDDLRILLETETDRRF